MLQARQNLNTTSALFGFGTMAEDFKVTPWEVSGEVDYEMLIEKFGTKHVDNALLKRKYGELHPLLRRGIVYSHRDMDWILDRYDAGEKFYLYTGRGPSGHTHMGHLMPWIFTKYLQDTFKVPLYFQLTDDEKFLFNDKLSLSDTKSMAYENMLDVIALGFDPTSTKILIDTDCVKTLYPIALKTAKKITFSTARAVFGFENSTNIGSIFYTSMQAAPAFMVSEIEGKNVPCLIPCGIDQDPHFRVARDIAPQLGYYKPALLHNKMFPGLQGTDKMSSSQPNSTIYTTDTPKQVRKKIMSAFTGGAVTVEEQRKNGGKPEICSVFKYKHFLFEENDEALEELMRKCRNGEILCGECKKSLADSMVKFIEIHQEKREAAKDKVQDYLYCSD